MLKTVLAPVLAFFAFVSYSLAQPLAPAGAVWTCYTEGVNPHKGTQDVYRCVKDTIIQSKNCRKISQSHYQKNKTEALLNTYYFHDSAGYVSVLLNDTFMPYFNFNAGKGDTTDALVKYRNGPPEQWKVIIDTTYVKNGLKHFELSPIPGPGAGIRTLLVERIFKPYFHEDFLSVLNVIMIPEGGTSLSCYNDGQVSYTGATNRPCLDSTFYRLGNHNSRYTFSKYRPQGSDSTPYYSMLAFDQGDGTSILEYSDQNGNRLTQGDLKMKQDAQQKVWVWNNNNWVLLYDFMAKAGDTITTTAVINPLYINNHASGYEDITTFRYVIDSVFQSGDELFQTVRNIPGSRWEMPGLIREGIGSTVALLGQPAVSNQQGKQGYLRCFNNNQVLKQILYLDFREVRGCDGLKIWSSVQEHEMLENIRLFPNPAGADGVKIRLQDGDQPVSMQITDLLGRVKETRVITLPETDIQTDHLESGIYFVTLSKGNARKVVKLVVQ